MQVIYARAALSLALVCVIFAVLGLHRRWTAGLASSVVRSPFGPTALVATAIVCFRILPLVVLYGVLGHQPTADVAGYFWPWGETAARGAVVYRDFEMHFGPLFPYVLSLPLFVWFDPRAIVALMVVADIACVLVTAWAMRGTAAPTALAAAAVVYFLSPAPLLLVVGAGQEDVWLWGFGAVAGAALVQRREAWAGAMATTGALCTKALFGFGVIPMLFASRKPASFSKALALTSGAALLPLLAIGGRKVFTLPLEEGGATSPPNIWFLANALTGGHMNLASPFFVVLSLALIVCVVSWILSGRADAVKSAHGYAAAWVITFAVFMLLSPKSMSNYTAMFFVPLTFLAVLKNDQWALGLTMILNVLAAVQTPLWYRLDRPTYRGFTFLTSVPQSVELLLSGALLLVLVAVVIRARDWLTISRAEAAAAA
jgi:hypothetical protein